MLDQNTFMETIKAIQEVAKTSPTPLSKEEIFQYFGDMELTDAQKDLVYEFFQHSQEESVEEQEVRETGEEDSRQEEEATDESEEEEPHSAFYQMYLDDLDALPTYTKEQMQHHYERLLKKDAAAQKAVSEYWMKQMPTLAKPFVHRGVLLEDLIQEGNMGLVLALPQISDTAASVDEVEQTLQTEIEEAMKAYVAETTGEDDGENTILGKVTLLHEAKKLLSEELGREPSTKELADYTKVSEQEIADILSVVKTVKQDENAAG